MKYSKTVTRLTAMLLVVLLCLSLTAPIAFARGSIYIMNYSAGMAVRSGGKMIATFTITGIGKMDEIGATSVMIYEDEQLINTYLYTTTSGMMKTNTSAVAKEFVFYGTPGKSYYCYVSYKCGKDGGWDNRGLQSNIETAIS